MDKQSIFQHYSNILDNLLKQPFFQVYFQYPYSINEEIERKNLLIKCGATRGCLIDLNYDYVVKYDIDEGYSDREIEIYEAAEDAGLGEYFAASCYLGTYRKTIKTYDYKEIEDEFNWYDEDEFYEELNKIKDELEQYTIVVEIPLYAYEKASDYCNSWQYHYSQQSEREAKHSSGPLRERNLMVAAMFIENYGFAAYEDLNNFLLEYGVNDIHCANIGIINDRVCLIDYAGFNDKNEDSSISSF